MKLIVKKYGGTSVATPAKIKNIAKKIAEETIAEVNDITKGNCHYFNTNAASEESMDRYIPKINEITNGNPLKLLLHSIAFGTTTNFFGEKPVTQRQMDMTVHVMGNSLLYWTQKLHQAKLLSSGSRVIGLTSEGNYLAMDGYGPVSVAKVAMEAIIRQIGWELGEFGITANAVQAGITPTRALLQKLQIIGKSGLKVQKKGTQ